MFDMINEDKIVHFVAGFAIALFTIFITDSCFAALIFSCVIGFLKEVYDSYSVNHVTDGLDFISTVVGGLTGVIIYMVI